MVRLEDTLLEVHLRREDFIDAVRARSLPALIDEAVREIDLELSLVVGALLGAGDEEATGGSASRLSRPRERHDRTRNGEREHEPPREAEGDWTHLSLLLVE